MSQFFTAGAALILALSLWGLGRKPKNFMQKTFKEKTWIDQKGLVETKKKPYFEIHLASKSEFNEWLPPKTYRERANLKKQLFHWISLGPEYRLNAIEIASQWGDSMVIPILKRGLRDSDSQIVICAAKAMDKFRCSKHPIKPQIKSRPPRNVFLMR